MSRSRSLTLLLLPFLLLFGACATSPMAAKRPGTHMTVRTTAYTAAEPGGARNACGELLHFGGHTNTYSAATDWSWMPLGTRFYMPSTGRNYVVEDYGSALVGRQTIDLFMPNRREMNAWGMKYVDIEIQEWGSPIMSLRMLEPRQKNSHVRTMVTALKTRKPTKDPTLIARR